MASQNEAQTKLNLIRNHDIFYHKFTNNGSSNLAVNGSVTPITFKLEGLAVENIILNKIDFIYSTDEIIDVTSFGSVGALANGILINIDGQQVIKCNGDVFLIGSDTNIHSVKITGVTTSIINGNWDLVSSFSNGISTNKTDLYVTIRDNLTGLKFFELSASGIKLGE